MSMNFSVNKTEKFSAERVGQLLSTRDLSLHALLS